MHATLNLDHLREQVELSLREALARPDDEVALKLRRRLSAARERLLLGIFGTCCECSETMSRALLAADPWSPFCSDCQEEIDFRRSPR